MKLTQGNDAETIASVVNTDPIGTQSSTALNAEDVQSSHAQSASVFNFFQFSLKPNSARFQAVCTKCGCVVRCDKRQHILVSFLGQHLNRVHQIPLCNFDASSLKFMGYSERSIQRIYEDRVE